MSPVQKMSLKSDTKKNQIRSVLTGSWSDVGHVNQRSGVLDEGLMMDGHACAEALRVSGLVEFCVSHRNGGFVFAWRQSNKV